MPVNNYQVPRLKVVSIVAIEMIFSSKLLMTGLWENVFKTPKF